MQMLYYMKRTEDLCDGNLQRHTCQKQHEGAVIPSADCGACKQQEWLMLGLACGKIRMGMKQAVMVGQVGNRRQVATYAACAGGNRRSMQTRERSKTLGRFKEGSKAQGYDVQMGKQGQTHPGAEVIEAVDHSIADTTVVSPWRAENVVGIVVSANRCGALVLHMHHPASTRGLHSLEHLSVVDGCSVHIAGMSSTLQFHQQYKDSYPRADATQQCVSAHAYKARTLPRQGAVQVHL